MNKKLLNKTFSYFLILSMLVSSNSANVFAMEFDSVIESQTIEEESDEMPEDFDESDEEDTEYNEEAEYTEEPEEIYELDDSLNDIVSDDIVVAALEYNGIPDDFEFVPGYVEGLNENVFEDVKHINDEYGISALNVDYLPTEYTTDVLPSSLRNQYPYGTCWAHTAMAISEMNMAKKGIEVDPDLSELQLVYFTYNDVDDPLGNYGADHNHSTDMLDSGGNLDYAGMTLMAGKGAVYESLLPYSQAANVSYNGLTNKTEYAFDHNVIQLKSYYKVKTSNINEMKKAIMQYGAVGVSYNDDSEYYNSSNNSYYYPTTNGTNHAVTVVGWDDDFSRSKFTNTPEGDGAWLIRNSWIASEKNGYLYKSHYGYFWMSYYDKSLADAGYIYDVEESPQYDNNYQYDACVGNGSGTYGMDTVQMANIFKAKGYEYGTEKISAVSFAVLNNSNVNYTIKIYKNLTDTSKPESKYLVHTQTGSTKYPGYYTVDLDKEIEIKKDELFSVIVEISTIDGSIAYYSVEASYESKTANQDTITCSADAEYGQSFIRSQTGWKPKGTKGEYGNVRIKALTKNYDDNVEPVSVSFDSNGGTVLGNISVIPGKNYGKLPVPTKYGYIFDGWYTALDGGTLVTADSTVGKYIDHTLYAHWSPKDVVIKFDTNGGNSVDDITVKYGNIYGTLPTPSKKGYVFEGWYTMPDGGSKINSDELVNTEDQITLHAHWSVKNITVSFDTNGLPDLFENITVVYGGYYGELPEVTVEGGSFEGWYTDREAGNKVEATTLVTDEDNHTLYARYSMNEYSLVFNLDGGKFSNMKNEYVARYGQKIKDVIGLAEVEIPQKNNKDFYTWTYNDESISNIEEISVISDMEFKATYVNKYACKKPSIDAYSLDGTIITEDNNHLYVTYEDILDIRCITKQSDIFYSINGEPNQKYLDRISISDIVNQYGLTYGDTITVTAIARKTDHDDSDTVTAEFVYRESKWGDLNDAEIQKWILKGAARPTDVKGLWASGFEENVDYTGNKIVFSNLRVFEGTKLLTINKDYTVSYKNNINAATTENTNPPTIIVKGKGNYNDSWSQNFTINKVNIPVPTVIDIKENGKGQKPMPTVMFNNKKLKVKADYIVYYKKSLYDVERLTEIKDAGDYFVVVEGTDKNFEGLASCPIRVVATQDTVAMKKVLIKNFVASKPATGMPVYQDIIELYDGDYKLTESDYSIKYENETKPGTAKVTFTGKGKYYGEVVKTYKIVAKNISSTIATPISSYTYSGEENKPEFALSLKNSIDSLNGIEEKDYENAVNKNSYDYTYSYQNNVKAGTATIHINGVNAYSGTKKISFKILPHVLSAGNVIPISAADIENNYNVNYCASGAKPNVKYVMVDALKLKEGVDYTITCSNNKKVSDSATFVIKGKGNFKGTSESFSYEIIEQDIHSEDISISAPDKVYVNKPGNYTNVPTIINTDGKKLSAGTDFKKSYKYYYINNNVEVGEVGINDIVPVGQTIRLYVYANDTNGKYIGENCCDYRMIQADVAKATVKIIEPQYYTGYAIEPDKNQITVQFGKQPPLADDEYDIVTYNNNVAKGNKATITIKGVGNYGGTKVQSFAIKPKAFLKVRLMAIFKR